VPQPSGKSRSIENEPEAAVLEIFNQLVKRNKLTRPKRSDDKKPAELGFVFSQLTRGMMIDPRDYMGAWSLVGGDPIQGAGAPPAPDPKYRRRTDAAFNTAMLVDRMIVVSDDDIYLEYPGGGRRISAVYETIINGIQPLQTPPIAPELRKRIEEARKVLYAPDKDGDLIIKSKLYNTYERNAKAYAQAVADYAFAQADAGKDPAKMQVWPVSSKVLRQAVDEAWDTWKTEGAEKIEAALATVQSVGISLQQRGELAIGRRVVAFMSIGGVIAAARTETHELSRDRVSAPEPAPGAGRAEWHCAAERHGPTRATQE
jgi:hypothetical protein